MATDAIASATKFRKLVAHGFVDCGGTRIEAVACPIVGLAERKQKTTTCRKRLKGMERCG